MDAMWEYNAPQYVDFTKRVDDDRADAYFGISQSSINPSFICIRPVVLNIVKKNKSNSTQYTVHIKHETAHNGADIYRILPKNYLKLGNNIV